VNCAEAQVATSALLDGELSPLERRALEQHLDECDDCRSYAARADALQRRMRVRAADPVPDLTAAILARAHPPRPGRAEWVRYALAIVALTELAMSLPALLLAEETGATAHAARHIGAMSAAMALGFLYTAWRPERAYGVLPIAAALALTMAVTGIFDAARGATPIVGEAHHVLELAGFALVWMLAGLPGLPRDWLFRRRAGASGMQVDALTEAYDDVA
jgi:predicted anti-sigma-YlaC factor YlaD